MGLGFRVSGLELRVAICGFRVKGLGLRVAKRALFRAL